MNKVMGRFSGWREVVVLMLLGSYLFAGCKSDGVDSTAASQPAGQKTVLARLTALPKATARPLHTTTPAATATPRPTPTPTATTTPQPTPTPTAVPITVTGDPRGAILRDPEPQGNARCGIVDLLDFPIDPPDASSVNYGGQGFGRFRGRYDQYHAGEDWQLVRGRSNLGVPVYSIGHGRVTYAQPLGWGRDQGVIIVRHTFADGSTVLSFYGHMDPESVTIRAGDCVVRGQKIAEIGQPRTPPHLHFEIRTHMPNEPGPGYWPVDPTEAGWLPPSQFIWNNRMASLPGVEWTRPHNDGGLEYIALVNGTTLITFEGNHLIGLNAADGRLQWSHSISQTVSSIIANKDKSLLYTVDRQGQVAAYSLRIEQEGTATLAEQPIWHLDLRIGGTTTILPLPAGGVLVFDRQDITAVSNNGDVLWRSETALRPFDWLLTDDRLIVTQTSRQGPIYSITEAGIQELRIPLNGRPVIVGDEIWLYESEGLYRLDPDSMTAELLYQLPQSFLELGSIVALPDGGAMIAHRDWDDSRLIAFNPDGTVSWQRSYAQLEGRKPRLLLHNERPYLLLQSGNDYSQVKLYALDRQYLELQHIFTGGTRSPLPSSDWFVSINDSLLLIHVGGGGTAALDPDAAILRINSSTN